MKSGTRHHCVVDWSRMDQVAPPRARTERMTIHVAGLAPIDALIARPEHPVGVTAHFVGFGIPMSDWERAKAALIADASNTIVVMCELPGFTRHGAPLPTHIRQDLTGGDPLSLAEATWACLSRAIERATSRGSGRVNPSQFNGGRFDVMGYSTGCSLAVAAMPIIQARHQVTRLTMIEPVALLRRSVPHLAADNITDLLRIVRVVPGDLTTPWVRRLFTQRRTGHGVHFSQADFWALVAMLASDDTRVRLDRTTAPSDWATWPPTDLVRGEVSRLTAPSAFTHLDADLAGRGVPGLTCLVPRLGHQLWHSMPALAALVRTLHTR